MREYVEYFLEKGKIADRNAVILGKVALYDVILPRNSNMWMNVLTVVSRRAYHYESRLVATLMDTCSTQGNR